MKKVASSGAASSPNKIAKILRKASGAPTFSVEYARDPKIPHHKIETGSLELRRAKCSLIFVDISVENGELDLEEFVKEQATAKGNFPGSTPIIWRGNIKTPESVARAAAAGCQGVAITFVEAQDNAEELIKAAFALGLEAIVEVQEKVEVERAIAAGATIIQVRFQSDAVESFKAFAGITLKKDIPKEIVALATVAGRQGGGEMNYANQMIKAGFNSVVFSKMMTEDKQEIQRYVKYILSTMMSKRSSTIKINENKGGVGDISIPQGWGSSETHM